MRKFIGLDVGDVRIGVAKCDPMGILATALEVIDRNKTEPISRIKEISGIQIIFVDERYTTTEAEHYLKNYSKKNGKERRKVVDMVAASIILQKYLDTLV